MAEKFDLSVIGAGPGGYVAAIKAAQNGLKVALIEKEFLGGTCLNVGCIPTKTLLANASVLHKIKHATDYGISVGDVKIDYAKMKERKDGVISTLRSSLEGLLKANGITIFEGAASFLTPNKLKVEGVLEIDTDKTIIATGSSPVDIPAFPCDHTRILNSTSILELTEAPKSLVIIGGGYIGCEFASLFAELGTKVTIVEALPAIVQAQGKDISEFLTKAFRTKGIEILTGVSVQKVDDKVHLDNGQALESDKVLVSVGRRIHTDHLQLGNAGLKAGERGAIGVNAQMETEVPGIYAIGDVTGISMLAHVASHQGLIAAGNAAGQTHYMHYNAVPAVIFTHPEIATVGMLPEEAGPKAKVTRYPFKFHGKSLASNENDGFAQVVTDPDSGLILGAQVIGEEASTMIAEMALAIANELTVECVFETIHAHPTLPEAWMEAALIANNTPVHAPPVKK